MGISGKIIEKLLATFFTTDTKMIQILLFTVAAATAFELPIQEGGVVFNQEMEQHQGFTGSTQQTIRVPQHLNVDGMTLLNDFALGISVYRTDAHPQETAGEEKLCYVTVMSAEEREEYEDFAMGVELLKHADSMPMKVKAPTSYEKVETSFLVTGNEADLSADYLAVAKQHCGSNRIVPAIEAKTGDDVSQWAMDKLRSNGNRVRRDTAIRDIYTCNDQARAYALNAMNRCNGVINDITAVCTFRTSACAYILSCPYSTTYHYWNCKGKHNFHNNICCNYECKPGSGK